MLIHENRIGIGTVQLGLNYGISNSTGKPSEKEIGNLFSYIRNTDFNFFDTAVSYGDSEEILGKYLTQEDKVVSKWMDDPILEFSGSLRRLKIASLYGWMAHRPEKVIENPKLWDQMMQLNDTHKDLRIGFSLNTTDELDRLLEANLQPSIVQLPYNILDKRFEPYFQNLHTIGCEIHCRSIYLQGLFFMKPETLSAFFDPLKPWLKVVSEKFTDKVVLASSLIHEVLKQEKIGRIIIGIASVKEFEQLKQALNTPLAELPEPPKLEEQIYTPINWPKL